MTVRPTSSTLGCRQTDRQTAVSVSIGAGLAWPVRRRLHTAHLLPAAGVRAGDLLRPASAAGGRRGRPAGPAGHHRSRPLGRTSHVPGWLSGYRSESGCESIPGLTADSDADSNLDLDLDLNLHLDPDLNPCLVEVRIRIRVRVKVKVEVEVKVEVGVRVEVVVKVGVGVEVKVEVGVWTSAGSNSESSSVTCSRSQDTSYWRVSDTAACTAKPAEPIEVDMDRDGSMESCTRRWTISRFSREGTVVSET